MTASSARLGEKATCPVHGATAILGGSPNVLTNKLFQARATDVCMCTGGVPSTITKGSSTVRTNNLQTAHVGLPAGHGGSLTGGSPNVNIGGPDGSSAGPVSAATAACKALAAGRASGSSKQTYGNCEVESLRQLLNAQRALQDPPLPPLTEEQALAMAQGYGAEKSDDPAQNGGMEDNDAQRMMGDNGCPVDVREMNQDELARTVESGTPVAVGTHARYWWGAGVGDADAHEILVTGVERDADGNVIGFIVNDTGLGRCGMFIPANVLDRARRTADGKKYETAVVPKKSPL